MGHLQLMAMSHSLTMRRPRLLRGMCNSDACLSVVTVFMCSWRLAGLDGHSLWGSLWHDVHLITVHCLLRLFLVQDACEQCEVVSEHVTVEVRG